jgi:hypothetical protein
MTTPYNTNTVSVTGTAGDVTTIRSRADGVCYDFDLFTGDWWEDRLENPHMFKLVIRVPLQHAQDELMAGARLLVEGRLSRWSVGDRYDNRDPVTGVFAERITVLEAPHKETSSNATPRHKQAEATSHE